MAIKLCTFAFASGVALHILVFSRGEWDRHSPNVAATHILLCITTLVAFGLNPSLSFGQCIVESTQFILSLIGGLSTSVVIYRLLFHPLRSFPGPLAARITSLWAFRENWPDLTLYIKLRKLHDQYDDFLRIKPRELSICHPDAINDIHGPSNRIRKGEFYEQIHPAHSLQFTRDHGQHKHQRRYWDKAFQTKALQEYSPRLLRHYKILMGIFSTDATSNNPVDISGRFMDLFFDVVSDLTFGKSFDTLTSGQRNQIITEFLVYQKSVGFVISNMWVFHLLRSIPTAASSVLYWVKWYSSSVDERKDLQKRSSRKRLWYANALEERKKEMQGISPDLYTHVSKSDTFNVNGIHEAQLAIIAGADTNAITASNACYLLCRHPEYQKKLFAELSDVPVYECVVDDRYLLNRSCLLSVINETLRLYPPVPGGLQRLTPPEGATIAGRYVPGDMVVSTPTYALQRDPRAFVHPNEFIPERWSSRPELILRKDAFVPFSYGAYNCAGKPLAMMQLRMVVAMIVKKFELSFVPGKEADYKRYIGDQADCFTLHIHPLPLLLKKRTNSN